MTLGTGGATRRGTCLLALLGVLAAPAAAHAGTATVVDGNEGRASDAVQSVLYTGGAEANQVTASLAVLDGIGTATIVDLAGATPGTGCVAADANTVRCTLGAKATSVGIAANAFRFVLGDGDDSAAIVNSPSTSGSFDGGAGSDTLKAGNGVGSNGDDAGLPQGATLVGGPGNDTLVGGTHDDFFDEGGPMATGADTMNGGGGGEDTVSYAGRTHPVTADLANDRDDGEAGELDMIVDVDNLTGGEAADKLTGNGLNNELNGRRGADTLSGGGGDDVLRAGGELDYEANGDKTDDRLDGGRGDDFLVGTAGANRFAPGAGRDAISAGAGNDVVSARDQITDDISCGTGSDHVTLDALDAIGRGCEHISRRGKPRAVLTGGPNLFGNVSAPTMTADAACPWDFGRTCVVQLKLYKGGKLIASGKHRLPRAGSEAPTLSAKFNARGRALVKGLGKKSVWVRSEVFTKMPRGASRIVATNELLRGEDLAG